MPKPSLDEVLKYAKPQVKKFLSDYAKDYPQELKEEMEQSAYLRLVEFYPQLEADSGWKSYVYHHCRGAVLDYIKFGKGFQEQKWSIQKTEGATSRFQDKIRNRVSLNDLQGEDVEIDHILGSNGIFSELKDAQSSIRWELVARMASIDEGIHALAKFILDIGIKEMTPSFELGRSRISQLIDAVVARFDDPEQAECPWFLQTCYAFGLCEHLGMPDVDQSEVVGYSIGWNLEPVDLLEIKKPKRKSKQLTLFDLE